MTAGILRRVEDVEMDYQSFADMVDMPCCVLSVEKKEGRSGEIRIIAANEAYQKIMGGHYHDGILYTDLVPQDNKFEDYCYRAAILKQNMHAYVEAHAHAADIPDKPARHS